MKLDNRHLQKSIFFGSCTEKGKEVNQKDFSQYINVRSNNLTVHNLSRLKKLAQGKTGWWKLSSNLMYLMVQAVDWIDLRGYPLVNFIFGLNLKGADNKIES